jgi:hypothetical protein
MTTDPMLIEDYIIKCNKLYFGQASNTVFAPGKVLENCEYKGMNDYCKQIIQGQIKKYDKLNQNAIVELLIKKLVKGFLQLFVESNCNKIM